MRCHNLQSQDQMWQWGKQRITSTEAAQSEDLDKLNNPWRQWTWKSWGTMRMKSRVRQYSGIYQIQVTLGRDKELSTWSPKSRSSSATDASKTFSPPLLHTSGSLEKGHHPISKPKWSLLLLAQHFPKTLQSRLEGGYAGAGRTGCSPFHISRHIALNYMVFRALPENNRNKVPSSAETRETSFMCIMLRKAGLIIQYEYIYIILIICYPALCTLWWLLWFHC